MKVTAKTVLNRQLLRCIGKVQKSFLREVFAAKGKGIILIGRSVKVGWREGMKLEKRERKKKRDNLKLTCFLRIYSYWLSLEGWKGPYIGSC